MPNRPDHRPGDIGPGARAHTQGHSRARNVSLDPALFQGRLTAIFIIFCALAVIIGVRLVWLQVIDAENIQESGSAREVTVDLQARRGTIYDRNGTILATTVDAYNVFCHPHMVDSSQVSRLANALAAAFGGSAADYEAKITQDENFVYLYKGTDEAGMQKIKDLDIEGVDFEATSKRVYPCGSTASQIIGVLNTDGDALTGLELQYDDILGGTDGQKTTEYSKEGVPVPGTEKVTAEVVNGQDIVVSIDVSMQQKLEESLALRVQTVEGTAGSAILMDSETGEIYACASSPTFDITNLSEVPEGATNLSGISLAFEPGSIMKPVTMLAALEAGAVNMSSTYDCPSVLYVDDYSISDAHERSATTMDVTTIIAESSNVGMSLVAQTLGFTNFAEAIERYQLTWLTGVDYPGEASGYVADRESWSTVQGYNISFGQGITVTPIEMVRFYAMLANDGVAVTPHFLLDVPSQAEEPTYETATLCEDQTALDNVETMLQEVVDSGTGTSAQIEGYRVVGKTGTAEIASESGGYQDGVYNISFIGYLPDASTNLVCFIGANEVPGMRSTVEAFQDIMTFAIDRYNITQD